MKPRTFTVVFALLLPALATAWFLLLDGLGRAGEAQGFFAKDFLVRTVPGPRLLLDGGSSTAYGYSTGQLEAALGMPVLNLGDVGSIPLSLKVARLAAVAGPGDVVVLSLEWSHYRRTGQLAAEVAADLYGGERAFFYYKYLPLRERLRLAFTAVPPSVLAEVLAGHRHEAGAVRHRLERGFALAGTYAHTDRVHGSVVVHGSLSQGRLPCDPFLFGTAPRYVAGDDFRRQVADIGAQLVARGVRVFVTFPPVVGEDCYDAAEAAPRAAFVAGLRELLAAHGIGLLGTPEGARLPSSTFWDTAYHPNAAGQRLRTQRLLEDLAAAGVPLRGPWQVDRAALRAALAREAAARGITLPAPATGWDGRPLDAAALAGQALLDSGWSRTKAVPLATAGPWSTLVLVAPRLPAAAAGLCFSGSYRSGAGRTGVYLNGHAAGGYDLRAAYVPLAPAGAHAEALVIQLQNIDAGDGPARAAADFLPGRLWAATGAGCAGSPDLRSTTDAKGQ